MFPFTLTTATRAQDHGRHGAGASGKSDGKSSGKSGGLAERAPALAEAAERVLARLVKGLQAMAGAITTIEGAVAGLASEAAAAVVAEHRPEGAAALLECPALGCTLVATLDATLVHALVELLCGGTGTEPPGAPRAVTPIDRQFAHIAFGLAAGAIQAEWASFGFGAVKATRIEAGLAADIFGMRPVAVGVVDLTLGVFGLHGTLRLALPQVALERFGSGEASPPVAFDAQWSDLLRAGVGRAPVTLGAYLDAKALTLGSLSALRVGQVLAMTGDARTRACLVGDGRTLYRGEIGQADGRYSLRVDEVTPAILEAGRAAIGASKLQASDSQAFNSQASNAQASPEA